MIRLNYSKLKNCCYSLLKKLPIFFTSFDIILELRFGGAVIMLPCLLVSTLTFGGDKGTVFFNSDSMLTECSLKDIVYSTNFYLLFCEKANCRDFGSKSGPKFCSGDSPSISIRQSFSMFSLSRGGFQGEPIAQQGSYNSEKATDKCADNCYSESYLGIQFIVFEIVGGIIGLIIAYLYLSWKINRLPEKVS